MKSLRKSLLLVVVFGGYLFLSLPSTTHGFNAFLFKTTSTLLEIIDKPQWRIGYNFTFNCPAAFRKKEPELKEMLIKSVQVWLEPLRERYPHRQFTDDFLFVRMPDIATCVDADFDDHLLGKVDIHIVFDCAGGRSFARLGSKEGAPAGVCMRTDLRIENLMSHIFHVLVHEVGHTYGLGDTYVEPGQEDHPIRRSTGGLAQTVGKQPTSVMAGLVAIERPDQIGEDDKNGIIYLYKWLYEDHPANDCFFPDYVSVKPGICEPKYPLIFEAKHGDFHSVQQILKDDPTLELNARDASGMTALHYAVQHLDRKMVEALLAKPGIKVNILGKGNHTPAQLARIFHQKDLAKMIKAHPSSKLPLIAWNVAPKDKLTTTWGHLKKQY